MLTLGRKVGEKIVISHPAGDITLTVVEIRGDRVRLGVEAPAGVPLWRGEIYSPGKGSLAAEKAVPT